MNFDLRDCTERRRTKSMGIRGTSLAPSRISAIQDEDKASNREEKEGSPSSEGSEEGGWSGVHSNFADVRRGPAKGQREKNPSRRLARCLC